MTVKPPSLVEDKADLYVRYKSTVNMDFKIDSNSSANTTKDGWWNFSISVPVGADPNGAWKFPELEDVSKETLI